MLGMTLANPVTRYSVARANVVESSVDPTSVDDADDGYPNGMRWHNTTSDTVFELMDNTAGAAVWVDLSSGGGGGGSLAVKDEGTTIVAAATTMNFVGSGVTVTNGGSNTAVVTITGGNSYFPSGWT